MSTQTFHSNLFDDDYVLRIRLPPDYDPSTQATYPLVVQLDPTFAGLQQYETTVGLISHHAAAGRWREAIVVGVDYPEPSTRNRDYLPPDPPDPEFSGAGADLFYRVLRDELLPYVELEYRVDPMARNLLGHSNGGIFAWYSTFRHDPDEGPLFTGVVAADNGYAQSLFTYERWHAERSTSLPVRLYATYAIYTGAVQAITFDAMVERLDARELEGFVLETDALETDHGGAVAPSYERGLQLLLGENP